MIDVLRPFDVTTLFVAHHDPKTHNLAMSKSNEAMAHEGMRLRLIRDKVGSDRFARAAHRALTTHETFDEALAYETRREWQASFMRRSG